MVYYLHFAYGGIHLLDSGALLQTNIGGKTTNLTSNSLHALLALNNWAVDVIDTLDNIGHGVNIWKDRVSLDKCAPQPGHCGKRKIDQKTSTLKVLLPQLESHKKIFTMLDLF